VVVNKIDIAAAVDFDRTVALANIRGIAPQTRIFEVSARTGEGMKHWYDYLQAYRMRGRSSECASQLAT
jgi:hydrogenase nickel incorporation protein HypB